MESKKSLTSILMFLVGGILVVLGQNLIDVYPIEQRTELLLLLALGLALVIFGVWTFDKGFPKWFTYIKSSLLKILDIGVAITLLYFSRANCYDCSISCGKRRKNGQSIGCGIYLDIGDLSRRSRFLGSTRVVALAVLATYNPGAWSDFISLSFTCCFGRPHPNSIKWR